MSARQYVHSTSTTPASEHSYGIIPLRYYPSTTASPDSNIDKCQLPTSQTTQILLIHQRSRMPEMPLFWTFPKGHGEPEDASTLDTAMRELREETGLIVRPEGILYRTRDGILGYEVPEEGAETGAWVERYLNPLRDWIKEVRYWVAVVEQTGDGEALTVQEKEVGDARWVGWDEAEELFTYVEGREMLRDVRRCLDGQGLVKSSSS